MTTLGDLLGMLHRAEASGTLELTVDTGRAHRVHLSRGFVVAVEIDGAAPTLAEILRTEHRVSDELLRRSFLRAVTSQRLHGDVLVHEFRIDKRVVDEAIRRQLSTRLEHLETLVDARIVFRVAIRPPRSAILESPLAPSQFLRGRKRARDRGNAKHDVKPAETHGGRHSALRVLGVSREADPSEIRHAYRRLARTFHPDLHPSASEDERRVLAAHFQAVTEAYRALVA
jgi:DnaJ-domain-containing protein 1